MDCFSLPYIHVRFFNLKTYVCLQLYENPIFCDFLYSDMHSHSHRLSNFNASTRGFWICLFPSLSGCASLYPHTASGSAFFHLYLAVLHSGKTPALDFSFHSFPLNLALKLCAPEVVVRSPACLRVLLYIQRPSLCFLEPRTVSPCAKAPDSATPWFSCPSVLLGFCLIVSLGFCLHLWSLLSLA